MKVSPNQSQATSNQGDGPMAAAARTRPRTRAPRGRPTTTHDTASERRVNHGRSRRSLMAGAHVRPTSGGRPAGGEVDDARAPGRGGRWAPGASPSRDSLARRVPPRRIRPPPPRCGTDARLTATPAGLNAPRTDDVGEPAPGQQGGQATGREDDGVAGRVVAAPTGAEHPVLEGSGRRRLALQQTRRAPACRASAVTTARGSGRCSMTWFMVMIRQGGRRCEAGRRGRPGRW